jgi:CubicO group peptidase (beta-lactamase class C family)
MSVALDFEENYTDSSSEYVKYRIATGWNPADQIYPDQGLKSFLYNLNKSSEEHGHAFLYRSPNTDLLGMVLESAAAETLANLFSQFLWQPMGAESDAYISLDRYGAARAAGGICVTVRDLARIGELFLNEGQAHGGQVISPEWLHDTCNNGSRQAWNRGNYKQRLPEGNYRNQWYQIGDEDRSISARGIHGQLLYINPARSVVIAKLASQPEPLHDSLTASFFLAFEKIAKTLGG